MKHMTPNELKNLESKIDLAIQNGYCFLPEFKWITNKDVIDGLIKEKTKTYQTGHKHHTEYCEQSGIYSYLLPILKQKAKALIQTQKSFEDIYQVTRVVNQYEQSECYRAHFDSHLFTLVTPIQMPLTPDTKNRGELILFNKIRPEPQNEFKNVLSKAYYKKYASENGIKTLKTKKAFLEFDFSDLVPILFLGRQSLHCNKPFNSGNHQNRITFLTRFFDPSPKWGIGNLNRILRRR